MNLLDFFNLDYYLYNPKTWFHNVQTFWKLTSIRLYFIVVFYTANQYIILHIVLSVFMLILFIKDLSCFLIIKILQPLLAYTVTLGFLILLASNSKYAVNQIETMNTKIIISNNWLKRSTQYFFYSSVIEKLSSSNVPIEINLYLCLYYACWIPRIYLILLSYGILHLLLFTTSTHEDVLYNCISPSFFHKVNIHFFHVLVFSTALSSNYINLSKFQINYICVGIFLKKIRMNNKNNLSILIHIIGLLLQNLLKESETVAFVMYYRKAWPQYRKVLLYY